MLRPLVLVALLVTATVLVLPPAVRSTAPPATFLVGFATRDIDPTTPAMSLDGQGSVYLGGFGYGAHRASVAHEYPIRARAMVVGDGTQSVALVSVEAQGSFAAYQAGAFGQYDIAKAVEAATDGALPRDHVLISSDHSHRGEDTTGAWGGLPPAYMQFIADQTRDAILQAYANLTPARLRVAALNESAFVTSDFAQPGQDTPDPLFHVMYVEDLAGQLAGVYGTFSAHATLHGSSPLLSPDWPGIVSDALSAREGGVPVVLGEADVGRTHPGGDRSTWEQRITDELAAGYAASQYVTTPGVSGHEAGITLAAYNPILMAGLYAGKPGCGTAADTLGQQLAAQDGGINPTCGPIARANTPPWMAGNTIRTLVTAFRIGDVLVWGAPGEIYPNAQWVVQGEVQAQTVFVAGLANDQLGYLISPAQDWYKVAVLNPTSDNTLFNVDVTGGDHVTCAALDLARELQFQTVGSDPTICATWTLEDRTLPP